jgi:hypothetical protein
LRFLKKSIDNLKKIAGGVDLKELICVVFNPIAMPIFINWLAMRWLVGGGTNFLIFILEYAFFKKNN